MFLVLSSQSQIAIADRQQFELEYTSQPITQLIAGINDRDRLAHLALSIRLSEGRDGAPLNQRTALAHHHAAARMGVPGTSPLNDYGIPVIRASNSADIALLPAAPVAMANITPAPDSLTSEIILDASTSSASAGVLHYVWLHRAPRALGSTVVATTTSNKYVLTQQGTDEISLWVMDHSGQLSTVSQHFGTDDPIQPALDSRPDPVTLTSPIGLVTEAQPNFVWNHQEDVNTYQLWIRDNTTGDNLLFHTVPAVNACMNAVCETNLADLALTENAVYQVRFRARNTSGWNQWAAPTIFTMDLSSVFVDVPLQSAITRVQPMTGIVLWADNHNDAPIKSSNEIIQLEYSYVKPSDIVIGENLYDWSTLETLLENIRIQGRQALLRWYYVYPGEETAVPNYLKQYDTYNESSGLTEGMLTYFPDWSSDDLKTAHLDFYSAFAERYDNDPRIAFLQTGFGLWAEYHIYEPNAVPGVNFPSADFQTQFLNHMETEFQDLKWSISIDAGAGDIAPVATDDSLTDLSFGLFDDSFMQQFHDLYNADMWDNLEHSERYQIAPHGGELSYYTSFDQENALNSEGIHGKTFEQLSAQYNVTYMLGNDQPDYQTNERIKEAGLAIGYRFRITSYEASSTTSRLTIKNEGVAPIYYDAYVALDGLRATDSLRGLLPGDSLTIEIPVGGNTSVVTIESDRLVDGQVIEFDADLL